MGCTTTRSLSLVESTVTRALCGFYNDEIPTTCGVYNVRAPDFWNRSSGLTKATGASLTPSSRWALPLNGHTIGVHRAGSDKGPSVNCPHLGSNNLGQLPGTVPQILSECYTLRCRDLGSTAPGTLQLLSGWPLPHKAVSQNWGSWVTLL